jgi:ABC-type transport system involved in multi-copper enzyme maturation permease subunit
MAAFVLARLTFIEAMRRRILLAALLLGLAFLALYGVGFFFMQRDVVPPAPIAASGPAETIFRKGLFNFMTIAGLYVVNFLTIAMAAMVSADTLAGEIGSGAIQTIVAKPVHRAEVVLGKWLGFAGLLALYVLLMTGGVLGIAYVMVGYQVPRLAAGAGLLYLEALLIMTLTLACSSRLSTLATGGVVFGLYGLAVLGGWVEQIGAVLQNQTAVNVGIISSLIIPSEALWRRASFEMTPPLARALGEVMSGPFVTLSVPSLLMVGYAGLYLLVTLALAVRHFSRRDL